jgi:hypothetical protein
MRERMGIGRWKWFFFERDVFLSLFFIERFAALKMQIIDGDSLIHLHIAAPASLCGSP